jgi:hypothetical protein
MLHRISPIRQKKDSPRAQQELMLSLQEAQTALQHAYLAFDDAVDPDLVEACIFEIRSLQSRINYLLRRMKAEEEQEHPIAASGKEGRRKWI